MGFGGTISCKKSGNFEPDSYVLLGLEVLMNHPFQLLAVSLLFTSVGFCQSVQETTNLQHQKFETNLTSGANLRGC